MDIRTPSFSIGFLAWFSAAIHKRDFGDYFKIQIFEPSCGLGQKLALKVNLYAVAGEKMLPESENEYFPTHKTKKKISRSEGVVGQQTPQKLWEKLEENSVGTWSCVKPCTKCVHVSFTTVSLFVFATDASVKAIIYPPANSWKRPYPRRLRLIPWRPGQTSIPVV